MTQEDVLKEELLVEDPQEVLPADPQEATTTLSAAVETAEAPEAEAVAFEEEAAEAEAVSFEEETAESEAQPAAEAEAEEAEEAEEAQEVDSLVPLDQIPEDAAWYVVHTYSGYENKVKRNLEYRVRSAGMEHKIFRVIVPVEEEVDIKEGKRRVVERRIFPGYVFVQMIMDDEAWYLVRNTPGVTGFVGSGSRPTPLRDEEVEAILKRMEAEQPTVRVSFREGQRVRIVDGPFTDFHGIVDEIDMQRGKVRLLVSFFGRETPVELDFLQVEKA